MKPGTRLGAYEILSLIGVGGMGEVYRARDTRLARDVAIKVLPSEVAGDAERLARFEREAKTLAALNQSNIAQIYGVEDSTGVPALVMELVDGPTLADRLAKGPIPLDEALPIAKQIAEALEAAHDQGIIHRDLKPANIKVRPDGTVKVLDFGLAKAIGDAPRTNLTHSPTITVQGTRAGVLLGTAAYMSPEQARGQIVDKRADIWAFGCVLWEMLTGRAAFARDTITDTFLAIVDREPDWFYLPASTPPNVRRLLRRCLQKDPRRRLRDLGDARLELEEQPTDTLTVEMSRRSRWPVVVPSLAIAGIAAVAAIALLPPIPERERALLGTLTRLTFDTGLTTTPTLSADGKLLAYASERAGRGDLDIWVQQVSGGVPLRVTTDPTDDHQPSFSPDGSQIAFRSERDGGGVYLVPTLGGVPRMIAAGGRSPRFSPDGTRIAYWTGPWRGPVSAKLGSAVFVVALAGGSPQRLAPAFAAASEPVWAPDGRAVVMFGRRAASSPLKDAFDLWFVPLDGRSPTRTGILDLQNFRTDIDDLGISGSPLGGWTRDGVLFSIGGALWLTPLDFQTGRVNGSPRQLTFGAGLYLSPTASNDGQIVFASVENPRVIERAPLNDRDPPTVLYSDGLPGASRPGQTADGSTIVFTRPSPGSVEIWLRDVGSGSERLVTSVQPTRGAVRATVNYFVSPNGAHVGYSLADAPSTGDERGSGFVVDAVGGVPAKLCDDCLLHGFLSDNRRVLAIEGNRVRVIDTASGASEDALTAPGRLDRTHASPDDRWITVRYESKVWIAPLRPGHPAPPTEWTRIDEPTTTGRPCGWSIDSRVVYLLLDTDGFRCLWAQRIDPTTGRPVDKPFAVRHFHHTVVQEFSTTYSNAISDSGFVYGGTALKANLWRLLLPSSTRSGSE